MCQLLTQVTYAVDVDRVECIHTHTPEQKGFILFVPSATSDCILTGTFAIFISHFPPFRMRGRKGVIWVDQSRLSVPLCSQENEILCLRICSDWILSFMAVNRKMHAAVSPRSHRCNAWEMEIDSVCDNNNNENNYLCIERRQEPRKQQSTTRQQIIAHGHILTVCIETILLRACTSEYVIRIGNWIAHGIFAFIFFILLDPFDPTQLIGLGWTLGSPK